MYTHHANGLGEEPAMAAPSIWDNLLKIGTSAVSTGFNIYNRVQNLTTQQKAATAAQVQAQQAQQAAQYAVAYRAQQLQQPQPQQSDFLDGWTMPLLLAGAAIVGVVLLRKK